MSNPTLTRRANAVWRGTGADGRGALSTPSGALAEQPYSARMRFEDEEGRAGTNPEELIAAAHAGCFSMALSFRLAAQGHPADELRTEAVLTMDREGVHWTIRSIVLQVRGRVPGISEDAFQKHAEAAKATCPVSKALSVEIGLQTALV